MHHNGAQHEEGVMYTAPSAFELYTDKHVHAAKKLWRWGECSIWYQLVDALEEGRIPGGIGTLKRLIREGAGRTQLISLTQKQNPNESSLFHAANGDRFAVIPVEEDLRSKHEQLLLQKLKLLPGLALCGEAELGNAMEEFPLLFNARGGPVLALASANHKGVVGALGLTRFTFTALRYISDGWTSEEVGLASVLVRVTDDTVQDWTAIAANIVASDREEKRIAKEGALNKLSAEDRKALGLKE
jgi:hypothetical protein